MKFKKKEGNSIDVIAMAIITISFLCISFVIKSKEIDITREFVEDGLVASSLAAAIIDLNEYGETNKIVVDDLNRSFDLFKDSLKNNLRLNDNFEPNTKGIINGGVEIDTFAIYNVNGKDIHMIKRQGNGNILRQVYPNSLGTMKTPDGVKIETTTIYSKIGMELKGYMNDSHYVYKERTVDITDKD